MTTQREAAPPLGLRRLMRRLTAPVGLFGTAALAANFLALTALCGPSATNRVPGWAMSERTWLSAGCALVAAESLTLLLPPQKLLRRANRAWAPRPSRGALRGVLAALGVFWLATSCLNALWAIRAMDRARMYAAASVRTGEPLRD